MARLIETQSPYMYMLFAVFAARIINFLPKKRVDDDDDDNISYKRRAPIQMRLSINLLDQDSVSRVLYYYSCSEPLRTARI